MEVENKKEKFIDTIYFHDVDKAAEHRDITNGDILSMDPKPDWFIVAYGPFTADYIPAGKEAQDAL
jgi:hypothetical protein